MPENDDGQGSPATVTATELLEFAAKVLGGVPNADQVAKMERLFAAYVDTLRQENPGITNAEIGRKFRQIGDAVTARLVELRQDGGNEPR